MIAILAKELRGRMRGWGAPVVLTGYVSLLTLISLAAFGLFSQRRIWYGPDLAAVGVEVFGILNVLQTALIMLIAPALTAGAIAGEKDRQTYDLLLSTRLSAFAIAAGKLIAGVAFMLLMILASVPLLSLVFLFGGVAPGLVFRSIAVQVVTALVMGAGGLYFSTLVRRTTGAAALGVVLALALGLGTVLFGLWAPPIGARRDVSLGTAAPGTVVAEYGPLGMSIRRRKEADGSLRILLPAAFYLNPGVAIVSAASAPGMPGFVGDAAWELQRATGRTPAWLVFLVADTALAALFFLGAWQRLEPRGWRAILRLRRRRQVAAG